MMSDVNFELWILAICLVVPFLCLMATIFLFFRKGINNSYYQTKSSNDKSDGIDFENQIAFQIACQQLDLLMAKMVSDLEKQRNFLKNYSEQKQISNNPVILSESKNKDNFECLTIQKNIDKSMESHTVKLNTANQLNETSAFDDDSFYKKIENLFFSGLTTEQIAKSTNIPQSEVELFIKLHLRKDRDIPNRTTSLRVAV